MAEPLPMVLIPGLNCSARLYAEQIPALWRFGPVQVADHTRDDSMDAIASRILADAPPRFALAGLSMGGFIALTIMRHAPERVHAVIAGVVGHLHRPESPQRGDLLRIEPRGTVQPRNEDHGQRFNHHTPRSKPEKIKPQFDLLHCSRIDFAPRMTMFRANGSTVHSTVRLRAI